MARLAWSGLPAAMLIAVLAGGAAAQDGGEMARALRAKAEQETAAGFAEFKAAGEAGNTQDAVCPHVAAGVRHFISANETVNDLIDMLSLSKLWESAEAAHTWGLTLAKTANAAIDSYNQTCEGWVEPKP